MPAIQRAIESVGTKTPLQLANWPSGGSMNRPYQ